MIAGHPDVFAIESSITNAFQRPHFQALGFFLLHIGGQCYGVREENATSLANAYCEVVERIEKRGTHLAPFATHPSAGLIADSLNLAVYAPDQEEKTFFGLGRREFAVLLRKNHIRFDDGDEAFDDGSRVMQFDIGDSVRLIGSRDMGREGQYLHDPDTLADLVLPAELFYAILEEWRNAVFAEWKAMPKTPDDYWRSLR